MRKKLFFSTIAALILVIVFANLNKPFNFENSLKNSNPEELTLTVYYRISSGFPAYYFTLAELMTKGEKTVVKGDELSHLTTTLLSIQELNKAPEKSRYTDAEIYYILESKSKGKLFDVLMTGVGNKEAFTTVFINGTEYEDNNLLYEAIAPYIR